MKAGEKVIENPDKERGDKGSGAEARGNGEIRRDEKALKGERERRKGLRRDGHVVRRENSQDKEQPEKEFASSAEVLRKTKRKKKCQ